ncbi:DNA excision repair protein ERCC-1 [Engystomops pustulosus]|uniref:DNA excision repair protein ERCC-1 n=1 Tax=Engystomops pustulosus TaxID=76066 RepID=UPI003AFABDD9
MEIPSGEHKRFVIPSQDPKEVPVQSLFKAPAAAQPSSKGATGSYADYVFQKESKTSEQKPQGHKTDVSSAQKLPSDKLEEGEKFSVDLNKHEGPKSVTSSRVGPATVLESRKCIVVSPRQSGNPLLKHIRNIPWEFGEISPDYLLGETCCAFFLSLRYHSLNPDYIHSRMKSLDKSYTLQILMVLVDVKDSYSTLKELSKICLLADFTLVLSWSPEEAARYLETFKSYEQKPADALKERTESNFMSQITDCLTTVKSINKTDSCTLLSTFGTLADLSNASQKEVSLCPGLGPQKAKRLYDALHEPFLK